MHSAVSARVSNGLVAVASLAFAAAGFWELGGPVGSGHVAASAAVGIAAENMLRWHLLAPVTHYTLTPPTTADWYCHHPFGIFWFQLPFTALAGHRELALRLPAALLSAATPPLVSAIARRLWGALAGAVSAVAFVTLPIALAFSNFNALEVPVMFTVLLSLWATVAFVQTGSRHFGALSLAAPVLALHADWSAWFYVAPVLVALAPRALRGREGWGQVPAPALRRWWALGVSALVLTAGFYLAVFALGGQLGEWLASGKLRSTGLGRPLAQVLGGRAYWLSLCFTPLGLAVGALSVPVVATRAWRSREGLEALPLAVLAMAALQYLLFPNGADAHIFWPQLFAPWFALGLGAVVATVSGPASAAAWRPVLASSVALGLCGAMVPDALRALGYGRRTGLRFDERGRLAQSDLDKSAAMRWLTRQLGPGEGVLLHRSVRRTPALDWALERPTREVASLTVAAEPHWRRLVLDQRLVSGEELQRLALDHPMQVVGPLVIVELAGPPRPLEAFELVRREPTRGEWFWRSAHAPVLSIEGDPFSTWELREHLGQTPNPRPTGAPQTLTAQLTAHDAALAAGDQATAAAILQEVRTGLTAVPALVGPGDALLLGVHADPGVCPRLHVVFQARGPVAPDAWFTVSAKEFAPPDWSLVGVNPLLRQLAPRFRIASSLWRAGFLYEAVMDEVPGRGRERLLGTFGSGEVGAVLLGELQSP